MKLTKLLVLSALWLTASSVSAAVPDGVWTVPEPEGLEFTEMSFDDYERYYLYNPASKMFFASGNEWNTRASISSFGYEVWFITSTEADAPEGSYEFWDNCAHPDRTLGDKNMFTDDGGSTWVDHAEQGNYSWSVEKVGDAYRIQNVALIADKEDFAGKYIGWKGDYADTRLYMIAEGEGSIDWKVVTADSYLSFIESEAYETYKNAIDCIGAALSLKVALEEAEALGANIAPQLAVYTNTASTKDELTAATTELNQIIDARKKLKTVLDEAKAGGFSDTAAAEAVYANGDATAADLLAALDQLNAALVEWGKTHATVANPADMSSKIVNPNFDNASSSGWSGDAPNMVGSGSHGPANVAEKWNATFDTYQDITDLPAGVYALGAQTMWRGSWNDMMNKIGPASKLYAVAGGNEVSVPFNYAYAPLNTESLGGQTEWGVSAGEQSYTDEETGTTYYIPNDPSAFRVYAEKGYYDTKVIFGTSDGSIRIGVKNPAMLGDADNWSCFDTFTLTYYGSGADAAQLYLEETIKNYSEKNIPEGTVYTESYLTAYNAALNSPISVSSFEEVATALGGIDEANKALDTNIELWKRWSDAVEKANREYANNPSYDGLNAQGDLADYCGFEAPDILAAHALTNEELEAEIQKLDDMIAALIEEAKHKNHEDGDDMTAFITNPGFDDDADINYGGAQGWTIDRVDGGNVVRGPLGQGNKDLMESALGYMNYCFESWHCHKWDIWQEITGLPKGMYELNVQGYVRCEVGGYTRGDELTDYPSPVYLYMNQALAQFPSVYSECPADLGYSFTTVESWTVENVNGNDYPNSMGGAAQCFAWDMYKMKAYGLIANDGDIFRIGVKMDANQDWWCIFDNFKLTYRKPTADVVKPILEAELEKLDLSRPMASDVYAQAAAVKEEAEAALASGDGQQMFDALVKVYDLGEAINNSVVLFAELKVKAEDLLAATYDAANPAAAADAETLAAEVLNKCENHELSTEDVEIYEAKIDAAMKALYRIMPADMDLASDEAPVNATSLIIANEYEIAGANSSLGWEGDAGNFGNDDEQRGALAYEFFNKTFDHFQVIEDIPNGIYEVSVNAFGRFGGIEEDYKATQEAPGTNESYLYAESGNGAYSVPLKTIFADAPTDDFGEPGQTSYTDNNGTTYYLPNNMVSAAAYFGYGFYQNTLIAKVDDGTLRIGVKKSENTENGWVLMDNWTLKFYGANSNKQPGDDPSGITDLNAVPTMKIEFFTLDGRKVSGQQKGILIQKRTLGNGDIIVKKIRK